MLTVDHIIPPESFSAKDVEIWHTLPVCIDTRQDSHPFTLIRNNLVNAATSLSCQNISSTISARLYTTLIAIPNPRR
jgi:hypothetical protein